MRVLRKQRNQSFQGMMHRDVKKILGMRLILAAAMAVSADMDPQQAREAHRRQVQALYQEHLTACAERPHLWARRGLLADREKKTVTLFGEATRLGAEDPVEFFMIAEPSAKDYEALIVCFASAGDVREALQAIGLKPGRPVSFSQLCFWPKGERVLATAVWTNGQGQRCEARLEDLVLDRRRQQPLERAGLVFVGSRWVPALDGSGKMVLAADAYDPYSIASNYNETETLLDVPWAAVQGDVYRHQIPNPNLRLPPHTWVEVILRPEFPDGRERIVNLSLALTPRPGADSSGLTDVEWRVRDPEGRPLNPNPTLEAALETFANLSAGGHDPFVSLEFADDLTVGALREVGRVLASAEGERGIRVEPPRPGHLYFKAFVPDERFRRRENRILQPWELHISMTDDRASARLVQIREQGIGDDGETHLDVEDIPLSAPDQLRRELDARGGGRSAILVYVPPALRYGSLMGYLRPVLSTHPHVHVFLTEEERVGTQEPAPNRQSELVR